VGGIVNKCKLRPTLIVIDVHRVITIKKNEISLSLLKVRRENSLSVLSGREHSLSLLCGREESLTNATSVTSVWEFLLSVLCGRVGLLTNATASMMEEAIGNFV
jgi:hypothetical protein